MSEIDPDPESGLTARANLWLNPKVRDGADVILIQKGFRRKMSRLVNTLLEAWVESGADTSILEEGMTPFILSAPGNSPTYEVGPLGHALPMYGSVSAGPGALLEGQVAPESLSFPTWMVRADSSLFTLRVDGGSMRGVVEDGDVVIVRQQPDAENGELVIAIIPDDAGEDRGYVKRLHREGGLAELRSTDGTGPRRLESGARIIGKVIRAVRYFEKPERAATPQPAGGAKPLPDPGSAGSVSAIWNETEAQRQRDEGEPPPKSLYSN